MREVQQKDYTYSNDGYISIFVGNCKSEELLMKYLEKDYNLLDDDCIGSEFGIDFGINTYDEDFLVASFNSEHTRTIEKLFCEALVFDINKLKLDYTNELEEQYNVAIVIGGLKYEGSIKEIHNNEFGYFKFLGTYLK